MKVESSSVSSYLLLLFKNYAVLIKESFYKSDLSVLFESLRLRCPFGRTLSRFKQRQVLKSTERLSACRNRFLSGADSDCWKQGLYSFWFLK